MTAKKKVLINSFLYTFSALLCKAINFFLLPVYTTFLTPEDYGVKNLVNSFTNVVIFIIAFSLYAAVIRFYADYKEENEKLRRFYGTVIIFVIFSSSIFTILGIVFKNILVAWFFKGISFYPIVLIALITLSFLTLHRIHQSILEGRQEGKKLTILNLIMFGTQVCLTLLFIGVFKFGVIGVLLSIFIVNFCYSIYMFFDLKRNNLISLCIDFKILKVALKYSIPILPHNISTYIANFVSRVLINISGTLASVGLYGVASQFAVIIDTVQSSVNKAFMPWFFEMMNKNDEQSKREILSLSRFLLIIYSLVYMVIGLFSQEIIIIMTTESYIMAWTIIPILVVGFSVKSIYYFYINILFYYKKASRKIFIATVSGSLADIVLAFALVPVYGMYGAAIAFVVAKIIIVAIIVYISNRYQNIGYRIADMLKIIIPSLSFMAVGLYLSYSKYVQVFSVVNLLYKTGIFIAYLIFIYLSNRKSINRIIKSGKIQQIFKRLRSSS